MPLKWDHATLNRLNNNLQAGLVKVGIAVLNRAQDNAPVLTSALKNSARITSEKGVVTVGFGSSAVRYARVRHEVNKKNPGTVHYLKKAADEVKSSGISNYFRGRV